MKKLFAFLIFLFCFSHLAHAQTPTLITIGTQVISAGVPKFIPVATTAPLPAAVYTSATSGFVLTSNGSGAATFQASSGGAGTVTSVTFTGDGTVLSSTPSSAVTTTGTLMATLATQTANTVLGALTATTPSDLALPSCSAATSALTWTSGTGFGCHTVGASGAAVNSITGDSVLISNSASTGAVTLTLVNAAATSVLGNTTGSPAAPSYTAAPVLGTSLTSPLVIGGTGAASTLTLESTSGAGTTDAIIFKNASQVESARITTSGNIGIGTNAPGSVKLLLGGDAASIPTTLTISTATFTPTFNTSNHFNITLVHASCPCTLANPSGTIQPGQTGVIVINQSSTGSDLINTYGSSYIFTNSTAPTLSTGANATDILSYYVVDATHIRISPVISTPVANTTTNGIISNGTKFTTSGCSISSTTGGATAGKFTLGANNCTAVITMNGATGLTAPNGWACNADDLTATTIFVGQSTSSTTTASISVPVTAGATDVISFFCTGY